MKLIYLIKNEIVSVRGAYILDICPILHLSLCSVVQVEMSRWALF